MTFKSVNACVNWADRKLVQIANVESSRIFERVFFWFWLLFTLAIFLVSTELAALVLPHVD